MVRVLFEYDEDTRKWECYVNGTESHIESRQAFSAVVLTCQELPGDLLIHAQVHNAPDRHEYRHTIIPAVE